MSKEVNLELLESYLRGDIGTDEVLDLEGYALSSEELTIAVKDYENALIQLEGVALKEQLKKMETSVSEVTAASTKKSWYAIAAVLLFLITAGFLWQIMGNEPEFNEYFEPFDQLRIFRGDGDLGANGMEAYSREEYEEAFNLLSEINENEIDLELKFYLAVSALASDRTSQSIVLFEDLAKSDSKYHQQVSWYLGLAYWKNEQPDKAISQLKIIQVEEYNYEEAIRLINQLD